MNEEIVEGLPEHLADEVKAIHEQTDDDDQEKAMAPFDEVDDEMMKFYEDVVWHSGDLEKSSAIWESSAQVPDFVKRFIERAVQAGAFWQGDFEGVADSAEDQLKSLFEEKMTQPQGWSLGSLVEDMTDQFNVPEEQAETYVRNETAALANTGREIAYTERDDSDEYEFYWSGPSDQRETPVCKYIKEQTHPNHGGTPVPMDELKSILRDAIDPSINPHLDGEFKGATPDRIEDWLPHFSCRHTFIRRARL